MDKVLCPFCLDEIDRDTPPARCPRCGIHIRVSAEIEAGAREMRNVVLGTFRVLREFPDIQSPVVLVQAFVDEERHLIFGWDDEELLRPGEVARIMGLTTSAITKMREDGKFPKVVRLSPSRPERYSKGQWRYPRWAVRAALPGRSRRGDK